MGTPIGAERLGTPIDPTPRVSVDRGCPWHPGASLAPRRRVLAECNGDRDAACRRLGIGLTTLWRKLQRGG
jgi:propionate catabolism operon transcriptional regulator